MGIRSFRQLQHRPPAVAVLYGAVTPTGVTIVKAREMKDAVGWRPDSPGDQVQDIKGRGVSLRFLHDPSPRLQTKSESNFAHPSLISLDATPASIYCRHHAFHPLSRHPRPSERSRTRSVYQRPQHLRAQHLRPERHNRQPLPVRHLHRLCPRHHQHLRLTVPEWPAQLRQ